MADAPVVAAPVVEPPVVAAPVDPDAGNTYSRKEFLEVASEKKMLADNAETVEAELQKYKDAEKKAADDKALAEGKSRELLDAANKINEDYKSKLTKYEETEKRLRDSALAKITDADHKAIAEKLPDVDSVLKYVELHTKEKQTPSSARASGVTQDGKQFKTFEEMKAANPGVFS